MASLGINSYEFSISWARILPRGRYGEVNSAGIDYYNKLIDALLLKGIQPFVVLNHFDIPIELEHRYGSWLSPKLAEDFKYLADICFKNFGDRVKYWVTFSEPNMMVMLGYLSGIAPPNRCSEPFGQCNEGDSDKEPFIAAHNIILAHAAAAKLYKTKYQKEQRGIIGLIVETGWFEPMTNSTADKQAAERAQSYFSNWFLDPIVFGRYPKEMQDILGSILPKFTRKNINDLRLGVDFIGINHYTSSYVEDCLHSGCGQLSSKTTGYYITKNTRDGIPIGETTGTEPPFYVYPPGLEKIVTYIKERYNNIPMFVTENGYCEVSNANWTVEDSVNDVKRVDFFKSYLDSLSIAIRKGADVRGYFLWTLLDSFEWTNGYDKRYGIHYVDFATERITPKLSAAWYREFIAEHKSIKANVPEVNPQLSQY